jgi:pimeloyl-ACP methyl ester carboxylesterase
MPAMSTSLADTAENLSADGPSATFTYRRVGPRGGVPLVTPSRGSPGVPLEQARADLAAIEQPVLYAAGMKDAMIPALTAFAAVQHLADATLVVHGDSGHAWAEFSESVTWPGFQARVPQLGKAIAEIGLEEIERNLGRYVGLMNEQA